MPRSRQASTLRGGTLLSGQGVEKEGKKEAVGGEGGREVKISSSGISQLTWLAILDYCLTIGDP